MNIPFILTENTITMVINNTPYTIDDQHLNYDKIIEELKGEQDPDVILSLINTAKVVQDFVNTTNELVVDLDNGIITYNDMQVDNVLVKRILEMYKQGYTIDPMINFLKNLVQNPSERAINELYSFLEYGKLPITFDGYFLAYKRVNDDYTSVHDGKTKNEIGTIVSMPRDQVDSDSTRTCSSGLHLCSFEYLSNYSGSKILILKVNPKDIVSIPVDYNNTKARACEYQIIGELSQPQVEGIETTPVLTEVVADLSDYELQPSNTIYDRTQSLFFQAAYTIGYNEGKNKNELDEEKAVAGDVVLTEGGFEHDLSIKEADDVNKGFELGYKHGRGHKKRLVPKVLYSDIKPKIV